jgi:hypothetical protein
MGVLIVDDDARYSLWRSLRLTPRLVVRTGRHVQADVEASAQDATVTPWAPAPAPAQPAANDRLVTK